MPGTAETGPLALDLLGLKIVSCHALETGVLVLRFEGGVEVQIAPLEETEHWGMYTRYNFAVQPYEGTHGYYIYSLPGEGTDWVQPG